jgi:septum site-determining protein MinC
VGSVPLTPDGEPDFGALAGEPESAEMDPAWAAGAPAALFVRRTLRSGMRIHHDGDVCILGDVNAGAEIVAGGDVIVWGAVRGMVHAGAGGDTAAVVCALLLAPSQLRLAELVTQGSAPTGPALPETARIAGGQIVVEPWSPRRGKRET